MIGKSLDVRSVYKPLDFKLGTDETQKASNGSNFAQLLQDAIGHVNQLQHNQEVAQLALATGSEDISVHQVMVATEQARLALDFTMAVRNKVMDAYNEIMRMQV